MKTRLFFLGGFLPLGLLAQTITIQVSGIRKPEGSIRIQFFDSKESFDKERAYFTKTAPKTTATKGALSVTYKNIPAGNYGIAILDDENNNQKMDYGLVLPKEGFGFSDYYHTGMTRPDFKKFCFKLEPGATKTVQIKVRYL